jgi:hypothetical protein
MCSKTPRVRAFLANLRTLFCLLHSLYLHARFELGARLSLQLVISHLHQFIPSLNRSIAFGSKTSSATDSRNIHKQQLRNGTNYNDHPSPSQHPRRLTHPPSPSRRCILGSIIRWLESLRHNRHRRRHRHHPRPRAPHRHHPPPLRAQALRRITSRRSCGTGLEQE